MTALYLARCFVGFYRVSRDAQQSTRVRGAKPMRFYTCLCVRSDRPRPGRAWPEVRKRPRRPHAPRRRNRVCLTASACRGSSLFLPLNLTETARCSPRPGTRPPSLSGDRVDRGGLACLFVATRRCVAVPPSAPSALRGPPGCFQCSA